MIKKGAIFCVLFVFLILICGCETAKGAFMGGAQGAKKDWQVAKEGVSKGWGAAAGTGTAVMRADEWMRENLW